MRVVISPFWGQATAMGAAAGSGCAAKLTLRAACQTLAHPHASYLGFYSKVGLSIGPPTLFVSDDLH